MPVVYAQLVAFFDQAPILTKNLNPNHQMGYTKLTLKVDDELLNAFNERRARLLTQLKTLDGAQLAIAHAELNALMDTDPERYPPGFIDPLDYFPPEISVNILRFAAAGPLEYSPYRWAEVDALLEMTLISHKWRDFILETPSLWADIHLYHNFENLEMKLALAYQCSQQCSLNLTLIQPHSFLKLEEKIPSNHRARVSSLTYEMGCNCHLCVTTLEEHMESVPPLPTLEQFRMSVEIASSTTRTLCKTFGRHPTVSTLSHIVLDEESRDHPILSKAEVVLTSFNPITTLGMVQNMPKVNKVIFQGDAVTTASSRLETSTGLLNLTSLSFRYQISPTILSNFDFPVLTYLHVQISLSHLSELTELLMRLEKLRTLKLDVVISGPVPLLLPIEARPNQSLHTLELSVTPTTDTIPQNISDVYSYLLQMVERCLGSVEELTTIDLDETILQMLSRPNILPRLRSIIAKPLLQSKVGIPSVAGFGSLKALTWTDAPFNDLNIQSDTLEYLDVQLVYNYDGDRASLDLGLLPALTTLRTSATNLCGSAKNLTSLSLSSYNWDGMTEICVQLGLDPDMAPNLTDLSGSVVDLDVLFILLETYNFRPEAPGRRISHLRLVDWLSDSTIIQLQEVIRGKVPNRPPYRELCWLSNVEMINDLTL